MATNLNLDADLAAIKALPSASTQWTTMVAALMRKLFHSSVNPWGPNATRDSLSDGAGLPIGAIMAFAGPANTTVNIARGFVRCDGRSLSRTDYAALFKVCGTRFGSEKPGVFAIPNLRRRMLIGRSTDFPVGTFAGRETKILSVNEMPTHAHGSSSMTVSERPDHAHSQQYVYGRDEFPDVDADETIVIGPSASLHAVPAGTQGWRVIEGIPDDFAAGRSGTPVAVKTGADGAHGHDLIGAATNGTGPGEDFNLMGPSIVLDWGIYHGVV